MALGAWGEFLKMTVELLRGSIATPILKQLYSTNQKQLQVR